MTATHDYSDLPEDFFIFIEENESADTVRLLLSLRNSESFPDPTFAVIQIECRRKYAHKLPSFLSDRYFLFPDAISGEQASDERVARYHASLIPEGTSVLDMTAGLGIDSMTIAGKAKTVTAIELDDNKAAALRNNSSSRGMDNYHVISGDSVKYVSDTEIAPDIIFIDPARRDGDNRRTYSFRDCMPDITSFYKKMLERGCRMLVKASPLLDITQIKSELDGVRAFHIICVKGDCKEVLVDLSSDKPTPEDIAINAVDLDDTGVISEFSIRWSELGNSGAPVYEPSGLYPLKKMYLYEPNAAVMKLHAANILCNRFKGLQRASVDCSVYLSGTYFPDFPGRILQISDVITKKDFKRLKDGKYNVTTRNYPKKSEELRRSLGVREGSDCFIYGIRLGSKAAPTLLEAIRIHR